MTHRARAANGRLPAAVSITGLGLQLREWDDADAPVMVELFDEPQVDRWTPLHHPFDLATARSYLDQARTRRAEGRSIQLAITSGGPSALGEILLFVAGPDGPPQGGPYAELAYAVGIRHRRQHLATRAVRLMTDYAYHPLALQQVILRINPDNAASTAVARATGFHITNAAPITRDRSGPLLTWRHQAPGSFPRPTCAATAPDGRTPPSEADRRPTEHPRPAATASASTSARNHSTRARSSACSRTSREPTP